MTMNRAGCPTAAGGARSPCPDHRTAGPGASIPTGKDFEKMFGDQGAGGRGRTHRAGGARKRGADGRGGPAGPIPHAMRPRPPAGPFRAATFASVCFHARATDPFLPSHIFLPSPLDYPVPIVSWFVCPGWNSAPNGGLVMQDFFALSVIIADANGNSDRALLRFDKGSIGLGLTAYRTGMDLATAKLFRSRGGAAAWEPVAQQAFPGSKIEIVRIEWTYRPD